MAYSGPENRARPLILYEIGTLFFAAIIPPFSAGLLPGKSGRSSILFWMEVGFLCRYPHSQEKVLAIEEKLSGRAMR